MSTPQNPAPQPANALPEVTPSAPQYGGPAQPPVNQPPAGKPFYKKWWFIAIIVVVILGLASMCGGGDKAADSPTATESAAPASTPSEQETAVATITMPDVTGQKGDAAKKAIEDAGITSLVTMTDVDGEDSVWTPANWSVVSQEPAAGTEVAADVEVTLMVNHDSEDEAEAKAAENQAPDVPREYVAALDKARTYATYMHMSKQGVYDQLTSEHGEAFPAEAAQYAVDNVQADWAANALESAKVYAEHMSMSDSGIRDQLVSEYGDKFTPEEADYAIAHLND